MSRATLANPPNFKVLIYRVVIDTLIHKTIYDINSIYKCDFLAIDSGKLSNSCLRRNISTLQIGVRQYAAVNCKKITFEYSTNFMIFFHDKVRTIECGQ